MTPLNVSYKVLFERTKDQSIWRKPRLMPPDRKGSPTSGVSSAMTMVVTHKIAIISEESRTRDPKRKSQGVCQGEASNHDIGNCPTKAHQRHAFKDTDHIKVRVEENEKTEKKGDQRHEENLGFDYKTRMNSETWEEAPLI